MLDTIPHLIDSTQRIINIINPGKTDFEIYAPYVAVFISVVAMFVNYFLTNRQIVENSKNVTLQIENSQKLLEQTIRANREDIIKDKLIDLKIQSINELINIKDKLIAEAGKAIFETTINYDHYMEKGFFYYVILRSVSERLNIPTEQTYSYITSMMKILDKHNKKIINDNELLFEFTTELSNLSHHIDVAANQKIEEVLKEIKDNK